MAKTIGIIPARYASSRFPGKPLVDIHGKTMIRRVYEQASKAQLLDAVVVATDDLRIADEVKKFGGLYALTKESHQSGTDRCAEVSLLYPEYEVVINIQGDEPFIDPTQIDLLAACFNDQETEIATLIKPVVATEELFNVNSPKVVLNKKNEAIYFSRQTIPYLRNVAEQDWLSRHTFFKHIGIYGYRANVLKALSVLPPSTLEQAESLEQLRWIENGYKIKTALTHVETLAIDSPEDLLKIVQTG